MRIEARAVSRARRGVARDPDPGGGARPRAHRRAARASPRRRRSRAARCVGASLGRRLRASCATFLDRNQITFDWLAPDAPDLAARWPGPALEPTTTCRRSSATTGRRCSARPPRDVAEHARPADAAARGTEYDTVILGGGPAGLAAAVYGASEGLRTLVIEREAPGGQAETSSRIENYLGFPTGVSGDELARRALQQAQPPGRGDHGDAHRRRHRSGHARTVHARRRRRRCARGPSSSPPASPGAGWPSTASTACSARASTTAPRAARRARPRAATST